MFRPSLEFSKDAKKDFVRIDRTVRRQISEKLDWFLENFDSLLPIPLTGEFREFFKLRAGDWRIFYKLDWENRKIIIEYIRHRRKAYKKHT